MKKNEELTRQVAAALGLAGEFRVIGDERIYVLHGPSWRKWGEALFVPLGNGEHAFGVAGALGMTVRFGERYALAQLTSDSSLSANEKYERHAGDRYAAARFAIARCAVVIHQARVPV